MTEEQLQLMVKKDPIYQEMLSSCEELEEAYLRIREGLPEAHREILDKYISLCEEMEYRRTCLALDASQS